MKFPSLIKFIIFCGLASNVLPCHANLNEYFQKDIKVEDIKEGDWKVATKDLNYDPSEEELAKIKKEKEKKPESFEIDEVFWANLFKIFLILGLVILVLFLLQYLVGAQGIKKATNRTFDPNETIDTESVAERIHDFDLETLIKQAIEKKEFTVATRLHYLQVIKFLSAEGLIKWAKDKTNNSYLYEIQSLGLKNQFRELTYIFERVWYGETSIDEIAFGQIQQQFQEFRIATK